MKIDNRFYVYILLDPRKPGRFKYGEHLFRYRPFYVGKGTNERWAYHKHNNLLDRDKTSRANLIRRLYIETKQDPIVVIPIQNVSEFEAFQKEALLIRIIGRIVDRTGPLTNLTEGGINEWGIHDKEQQVFCQKKKEKQIQLTNKREINKNFREELSELGNKKMKNKMLSFFSRKELR